MMTTVNEDNNDKRKVPDEFIYLVFRPFVLLPNSMSKFIYNRCTCRLIIKTTAAHVHAYEQMRLRFHVLVRLFRSS